MKKWIAVCVMVTMILTVSGSVQATTVWNQGFETDASGWLDADDAWYGTINRVASGGGTLGLTSASGSNHAEVFQSGPLGDETGVFSRFDGYRDVWPGSMTASIDVYLDNSWSLGEGFDYSVAVNGSDNNHQQDFIFHITKDTSTQSILVAGDNNTNFDPREDLETLNHYEVTGSGWYTFEHVFRDFGDGTLAVDMNLRDSAGVLLFSETRNTPANVLATEIGGNRYAWFTNVDIASGIGVDDHTLTIPSDADTGAIPEPMTMIALGMAVAGLGGYIRKRRTA